MHFILHTKVSHLSMPAGTKAAESLQTLIIHSRVAVVWHGGQKREIQSLGDSFYGTMWESVHLVSNF